MTRKHFKALAEALKEARYGLEEASAKYQWEKDVNKIADTLKQFNERFDREKFIKACKGE